MLILGNGPPLLGAAAMRAAEAAAIESGVPALRLMERASAAATAAILAALPSRSALVLCGPGNNGGDGYGVALGLRAAGVATQVAAFAPPQAEPAATMAARWDGPVLSLSDAGSAPLIVDALFGTGLGRQLPAEASAVLERLAGCASAVAALDISSGIEADSGAALGPALAADLTIAFGAAKYGHVQGQGARLRGRLVIADIGLDLGSSPHCLVGRPRRQLLPAESHKYTRGHVLVVAGEARHGGAAGLAALAALRVGAGLVTLIGPTGQPPALALMRRSDSHGEALLADPRTRAVLIGPGLGVAERSRRWMARLMDTGLPLVLDAGALALVDPGRMLAREAPLVLTPHEGEFRALFGDLGENRIGAVQAAASASGATVLLKGPETIIAAPDGRLQVNLHAPADLATAGSGDVLAGIIAGLLGQGMSGFEAAAAAAWLHGEAARRHGPGLIADDLPGLLPAVLAAL